MLSIYKYLIGRLTDIKIFDTTTPGHRALRKNVKLSNVPDTCKVYCFVFGSSDADKQVKKDLDQ